MWVCFIELLWVMNSNQEQYHVHFITCIIQPYSNGLLSPHPTGSDRTTTRKDSIYKLHTIHNPLIHSDKG